MKPGPWTPGNNCNNFADNIFNKCKTCPPSPLNPSAPVNCMMVNNGEWSTSLRRNGHLIEARMRASTMRWSLAFVLLAVSIWTANLTLFNWWAAGGPPAPNPHQYAMRGNVFAVATLLLFGAAVGLGVFSWKRGAR